VLSIVGRFLEHSRVYYFHANGDERVLLASADWMERNFFRRVEVCFSIEDDELKSRILADLDTCLSDNSEAWELRPDGRYELLHPVGDDVAQSAQSTMLRQLSENVSASAGPLS
jgi:polyphosphate kinase